MESRYRLWNSAIGGFYFPTARSPVPHQSSSDYNFPGCMGSAFVASAITSRCIGGWFPARAALFRDRRHDRIDSCAVLRTRRQLDGTSPTQCMLHLSVPGILGNRTLSQKTDPANFADRSCARFRRPGRSSAVYLICVVAQRRVFPLPDSSGPEIDAIPVASFSNRRVCRSPVFASRDPADGVASVCDAGRVRQIFFHVSIRSGSVAEPADSRYPGPPGNT